MDLPVKWHLSECKLDMKQVFQENALGILLIQLPEIFHLRFESIQCNCGKDFYENFEGFRAFSRPHGTKSSFCPRSIVHIALLLSKMGSSIKISKMCSEVIQRTLRSGKNWLRYSFFRVISRVTWPNLRAWPKFRAHFESPTHTGKIRQCVHQKNVLDKNHWKGSQWIAFNKVDWGCAIFIWKFFLKYFFCCLKVGILPVKTPFPRMKFCYFFPNFGRPPDLNSDLYRLCGSLDCSDTFWARGWSWITDNKKHQPSGARISIKL